MRFAPQFLAMCLPALLIAGCVTPSRHTREVTFSGVTRQDVSEIEQMVTRRSDILKPVVSVDLMDIGGGRVWTSHIVVVTGRNDHIGDTFEMFRVAKRDGRWRITSPVQRETIVVTSY